MSSSKTVLKRDDGTTASYGIPHWKGRAGDSTALQDDICLRHQFVANLDLLMICRIQVHTQAHASGDINRRFGHIQLAIQIGS